jgi:hypothetical protein
MPRSTARRIIVADTPEELDALTAVTEAGILAGANPRPPANPPVETGPAPGEPEPPVIDPEDPDAPDPDEDDDNTGPLRRMPPEEDPLEQQQDLRRSLYDAQRHPTPRHQPVLDGQVMGRPLQRYESRITIVEAWQYPGPMTNAPEWVDKNWIGFAGDDQVRGIPAGGCLRVPLHGRDGDVVLCRIGDYITQQEVKLDARNSDLRIDVWPREHFQKMFMPAANTAGPA